MTAASAYILLVIPWLFIWSKQTQVFGLFSIAALCNLLTLLALLFLVPVTELIKQYWKMLVGTLCFFLALLPGSMQYLSAPGTLRDLIAYTFFFFTFFVLAALSLKREKPIPLGMALGLGALISLIGVAEYIAPEHTHVILKLFRSPESLTAVDNIGRAASVFTHRNIFGCFSALLAIGVLTRINRQEFGGLPQAFWFLVFACALSGVASSTSKNALLALMTGFATIAFGKLPRTGKLILASLAIVGCITIAVAIVSGPAYGTNSTTKEVTANYVSESPLAEVYFAIDKFSKGRLHLWKYWWNKKLHKARYLWKGIGIGQFRVMHWDSTINAHSTYAQTLFEGGAIGLCALLALLAYGGRLAYTNNKMPVYITLLTTLLFDHFFDYSLLWSVNVPWLMLL